MTSKLKETLDKFPEFKKNDVEFGFYRVLQELEKLKGKAFISSGDLEGISILLVSTSRTSIEANDFLKEHITLLKEIESRGADNYLKQALEITTQFSQTLGDMFDYSPETLAKKQATSQAIILVYQKILDELNTLTIKGAKQKGIIRNLKTWLEKGISAQTEIQTTSRIINDKILKLLGHEQKEH